MASQKQIRKVADDAASERVYDALETLLYGTVTGSSGLRRYVEDGSTWTLAFQKGEFVKSVCMVFLKHIRIVIVNKVLSKHFKCRADCVVLVQDIVITQTELI